jgi:hypothetical protein
MDYTDRASEKLLEYSGVKWHEKEAEVLSV